jgi:hypothetical protein
MFYTVEGEIQELELLIPIYRNNIVENMDLENELICNGHMEADMVNKEQGEEEDSFADKIDSYDEDFSLLEMAWASPSEFV